MTQSNKSMLKQIPRYGDPEFRKCKIELCNNHAPTNTSLGYYCSKKCKAESAPEREAKRKARVENIYNSDEEAPSTMPDMADFRKCDNPPCYNHSPVGAKYGKYCCKQCKTDDQLRKTEMMNMKKRRIEGTTVDILACCRLSCYKIRAPGEEFGRFCSALCAQFGY